MATTPFEIPKLGEGLTLTCDVFPRGSDTADQTGITLTEETNRKGIYTGTITALSTGLITVIINLSSGKYAEVTSKVLDTTDTFIFEDGVDVISISGGVTAATNLESQYDGVTGVTGDTFPATQAQVGSITSGGGGLNTIATALVIETGGGTESSGTVTSTEELDGTLHTILNDTGNTDFYYEFNVTVTGVATGVIWDGFVNANNDSNSVFYFDWIATTYKQIGTIAGQNATTVNSQNFDLPIAATDTNGDVRVKFTSSDSVDTNTDRIFVQFTSTTAESIVFTSGTAQGGSNNSIQLASGDVTFDDEFRRAKVLLIAGTGDKQEAIVTSSLASTDTLTITPAWITNPDSTTDYLVLPAQAHSTTRNGGYDDATVYVNTATGQSGQEIGVNGTSTNRVDNLVDAYAIAVIEDITKFDIGPGSSLVLPVASTNRQFLGSGYLTDLNNADVSGVTFIRCSLVTGMCTAPAGQLNFTLCGIGTGTYPPCTGLDCGFGTGAGDMTFTIGTEGNYTFGGCATVFDSRLILDFNAALNASEFFLTDWRGGEVEIQNAGTGTGTYKFHMSGNGKLLINANCSDTLEIELMGHIDLDNQSAVTSIDEKANVRSNSDFGTGQSIGYNLEDMAGAGFVTSTDSLENIKDSLLVTSNLDTSLTNIHLDHLFAVDYDPSSIPGVAGAWANEAVEDDGQAAMRFTAKMMENIASSGGGFITAPYKWSTNTDATDPSSGTIKANNATLGSITEVYIDDITGSGGSAIPFIESLVSGDRLVVARENQASNFFILEITGVPVDNTGFYTITGTVTDSGGSLGNNNSLNVTFAKAATDAATIASATWNALTSAHTNAGSFGLAVGDVDIATAAILIDTGTTIPGTITTMQTDVTAILADTNELQSTGVTLANGAAHGGSTATLELGSSGSTVPLLISNTGSAHGMRVNGGSGVAAISIVGSGSAATIGTKGLEVVGTGGDIVADVTGTVATVTTNTDMRGTDSAATAANLATLQTDITQIKGDLPIAITKNVAFPNFMFMMVLASDDISPGTGLTVTATRSIDGAAFASAANSVTEVSDGWYKIDFAASDVNGDIIAWRFTAATANPTNISIVTQP